jgi:Cu2+-exporting ATPase
MAVDFRQRFWVSVLLSLPVILLSSVIQGWFGFSFSFVGSSWVAFGLATVVYFYGGWPFLREAKNELSKRQPGMMTLVAIGITTAFGYSLAVQLGLSGEPLLWELVTLVAVMLLGHWIEMRSVMGASNALSELAKLMPDEAHRIGNDGEIKSVSVDKLRPGDKVLVKPGEKIPVDGEIIKGETEINASMVTGESKLVPKGVGDDVIAGSINGDGSTRVAIQKTGKDTYLSRVMNLVKEAQAQKSKTQKFADRAAGGLAYVAVSAGLITFLGWLLFTAQPLSYTLQRTIAVIVIACPHALGLAIPLVSSISTSLAAQQGLLIRNRTAFERAGDIDAVIFDKTGTLTKGEFAVDEVFAINGAGKEKVLSIAGSLEAESEHPIGEAIAESAEDRLSVDNFRALPGRGVEGEIEGQIYRVVSPGYLQENNIEKPETEGVRKAIEAGKTVVYLLEGTNVLAVITLDDVVRESAKKAIDELKANDITPIMLTGDAQAVARRVGQELGIDEIYAEVLPDEKAKTVKDIKQQFAIVAMVGDGVNDAPALATADVGIAIGSGTDVAAETADIVLVNDDPQDVSAVISLGRQTYRKMVQNLWWAAGYNIVALPLAAGVLAWAGIVLSPAVGAALMAGSTVIVAFNATLLRRYFETKQ